MKEVYRSSNWSSSVFAKRTSVREVTGRFSVIATTIRQIAAVRSKEQNKEMRCL